MKKHLKYLLTALTFLLVSKNLTAQTTTSIDANLSYADTTNIALRFTISEPVFDSLVNKFVDVMQKDNAIKSLTDNIILFRLYNTLDWELETPDKDIYSRLQYLFNHQYLMPTLHNLDAVITRYGEEIRSSKFGFVQKGYYHVIFHSHNAFDTSDVARKSIISGEDFKSQIKRLTDIMQKCSSLKTINDYLLLAKLFNTLWAGKEYQKLKQKDSLNFDDKLVDLFSDLVYHHYLQLVMDKLNARNTTGSGDPYSIKYDLRIGPSSRRGDFREKDIYQVIWK